MKKSVCRPLSLTNSMMSVILTIASLGTRVALAYLLSATPLGVMGIWLSVPIGWALADAIGIGGTTSKPKRHNETAGRRSKSGSLPAAFL